MARTPTGGGRLATAAWLAATALLAVSPAAARDPLPSFAPILKKAEPAVVNVATSTRGAEEEGRPESMQDLFRRFFEPPGPHVRQSLGSGFIISPDGEIVTNYHVVQGAQKIRVRLASEEELEARVVGTDEKTDVALVRVKPPRPLDTLPLGDSDAIEVGDWVLAIGNPFGLAETATVGIVSAKGRFLGAGPYDDFIQTDASINPGNSGGPLIDQEGRVVGVNAAILAPAGGNVGIGFAVPINLVNWVVEQLRASGKVTRGWIGLALQPLTPELARSFKLETPAGALVADVTPNGPAGKAGIQRGDVIVRWNDREIRRSQELPLQVASTAPGTRVPVTIVRNGRRQTMDLTVASMPAEVARGGTERPSGEPAAAWGMTVEPLSAQDARRLGLRPGAGLVVTDVDDGSPADEAGLESGDVILQVNRRPVRTTADLRRALAENPHHVLLLVRRGTASLYVEMNR